MICIEWTPRTVLAVCVFTSTLVLSGCGGSVSEAGSAPGGKGGKGGKRGDIAVPVTVAKAVARDVPVEIKVIGTVDPYSSVSIKAQVAGQLEKVHYREGDFVKQGDLLFSIDARTYEAQLRQIQANIGRDEAALRQAQSNLARDESQERYARSQAGRYQQLAKEGVFSKEQNDQMQTAAQAAAEAIQADRAAIESARAQLAANHATLDAQKVLLGYTKIYAPISGTTGAILAKAGNVVVPSSTELAIINQIQPVYVTFAVPEQHLGRIRQLAGQKLLVRATPEDGSGIQQTGTFAFLDNTVDTSTGTIRLKATFPNDNRLLWPGQFVRVVLELGRRTNAVVAPSQALQSSQEGPFIYVVKQDRTVEQRPVTPGDRLDQDVIIEKGLQAGETVVMEGQLRLVPGSRVQIRDGSGAPGGRPGRKQAQAQPES